VYDEQMTRLSKRHFDGRSRKLPMLSPKTVKGQQPAKSATNVHIFIQRQRTVMLFGIDLLVNSVSNELQFWCVFETDFCKLGWYG
jgi:hypothetical protein